MTMDLLLTHGWFLSEDPKELEIMRPYPPLGLLYLSSHLRRKGFDVEIYDATFGSRAELERVLEEQEPATLGVYATLLTRPSAVRILEAAKARGWRVVLGGPEPANYAREYLTAGADLVVEGEGEVTLEELLAGRPLERVAGVHYLREDGRVAFTGPRAQIADLDAQPWPDRERIDLSRYLKAWRETHDETSLNVITARGCPYQCRWCSHSTFGRTHRRRSPAGVVDEVEWLVERYGPDQLWIADDVFTIRPRWVLEYAAELRRRGLRIPFESITRADRLDERMADALAELGARRVWVGSESGSQRILDAMQRGVTVEQVRRSVELLRERGIETGMFLMWGYEGEQIEDIEATVEHVKACLPDVFFTTVSYPIRGTPYFEEVEQRLEADGAWRERTDRQWKIRGRRSRRFFSFADRLLKSEVRLRRGGLDDRARAALEAEASEARSGLRLAAVEAEA